MAVQTATNPETNEKVILVDGAWLPISQTATNPDTGARAYLANGNWVVDDTVPTAAPEETSLLGYGLETGKALLGGAAGLLESAATGAAFILPEEAEQAARARIAEIGGGVQDFLATDEAYEGTYTDLMKGVGSTLPFLAAAPLGVVGLAAGVFTGVTAGAGEAAQRAEAAGATEDEISKAAALGTIPGALEMFGPSRIVKSFRGVLNPRDAKQLAEEASKSIRNKIVQRVRKAPLGRVSEAALTEGVQEAITEIGQNLIQRGVYDPERGVFTGTNESFGLGAGVGGLLSGLTEAILPFKMRAKAAREAKEREEIAQTPVGETRDMFPEAPAREGPEPEQLMDVGDLAGVTEEDPIQVEAEAAVQARYSEAPLSPDAFAAAVANEVDILRSQTPAPESPTPETDLIADLEETQQVEALLDEDAYAAIEAEEAAILAQEAATADAENAELDRMQAEEDAEFKAKDKAETAEIKALIAAEPTPQQRTAALTTVLQNPEVQTLEEGARAFKEILDGQDFTNTNATDTELQDIFSVTKLRREGAAGAAPLEAFIKERVAKPAKPPSTLEELYDSLNITPNAPIRRRAALQGKEINSPEVREALEKLYDNKAISKQTRTSLESYLAKTPAPAVAEVVEAPAVAEVVEAPAPAVAEVVEAPPPPVRRTFTASTEPAAPTTPLLAADMQVLEVQGKERVKRDDTYTPTGAATRYLRTATDPDQALRIMAFESVEPIMGRANKKQIQKANAAISWAKENLSPETSAKLDAYVDFYTKEESRVTRRRDEAAEQDKDRDSTRKTEAQYEAAADDATTQVLQDQVDEVDASMEAADIAEVENTLDDKALEDEFAADTDPSALLVDTLDGTNPDEYPDDILDNLREDAVSATMPLVSEEVNDAVLNSDLTGALTQLSTDSVNSDVRKTAAKLAVAIKGTKVEFVEAEDTALLGRRGKKLAGSYNPVTDVIKVNIDAPLRTHTLLHETAHAVTHKTLSNKSHPVTLKLTKLYNDVKDKLDGSYGTETLRDFVAEVYTNPQFRATLAGYKPAGAKLTAWQRFTNAVKSLFGIAPTEAQDASQKAIEYIDTLIAESLDTRNATTVYQAMSDGDGLRAVYDMMGGGTKFASANTLKKSRIWLWGNTKALGAKARLTVLNGMSLQNVVELAIDQDRLPSAEEFEAIIKEQDGFRNESMKDFKGKLDDFRAAFKFDSTALDIFNTLVGMSTIEGVDPTKPRARYEKFGYAYTTLVAKTGKLKVVEKISFETAAERDAAIEVLDKTKVVGEIREFDTNAEKLKVWDEVNKLYGSLTAKQRGAYTGVRDMYSNMNDKILEAIDSKLDSLNLEKGVKNAVKDQLLRKILTSGVVDPYFKLDRKGDFWVQYSYKDAKGQTTFGVSAHPSEGARDVAIEELGNDTSIIEGSISKATRPEIEARGINLPTTFLVGLLKELKAPITITEKDANGKSVERKVKLPEGAIDFVNDLLFKSLPDQSLVQSHRERKGVAGYETQALKVFEDSYPMMINSLANIKFEAEFARVAKKIREEAALLPQEKFVQELKDTLIGSKEETNKQPGKLPSYLEFAKNPYISEGYRMLRAGAFMYTLGFNVSSAAVNMSTLPLIVGPLLSGKFGGVKATKAMARAMKMYMGTAGDVSREGLTETGEMGTVESFGGLSFTNEMGGPLDPLKKQLKKFGIDTRTISSENADYENPTSPIINKASYVAAFVFNHSERAIRQVTAASSYILEIEKAYKKANPGKAAKKLSQMTPADIETFGPDAANKAVAFMEYANSSALLATAPRWAQTGIGSLLYQFKRFPAQILYIQMSALNAMKRQLAGTERTEEQIEDDRVARNAFIYMNATGAALVGAKGVPFYGLAAWVMDQFMGEDEDDTNTRVAKTIGDKYYYGLIARGLGVDVTDRISLTNLMIRDKGNYRPENQLQYAAESFGGPTIGIMLRLGTNLTKLGDDNPRVAERAIEGLLPTAFSNAVKSNRYMEEGYKTSRGDDIVSDVRTSDPLKQLMGFTPARFRAEQDKLARDRRVLSGVTAARSGLTERLFYALRDEESDSTIAGIEREIEEFNEKHPEAVIKASTIRSSIRTRRQGSVTAEENRGNVISNRRYINALDESNAQYFDEL
tara:strand:+ start:1543 stop:7899 length:6357 start_codon:yes stop_codon:yes gene_type:complete